MGRGGSGLGGSGGGGKSLGGGGGGISQLAKDLQTGTINQAILTKAADRLNSIVNLADSVGLMGDNGNFLAFQRTSTDTYNMVGTTITYTSRNLAAIMADATDATFSHIPFKPVTFLDDFGNRQHAAILPKLPFYVSPNSARGSVNGYTIYKSNGTSLTSSNYDYIAVK